MSRLIFTKENAFLILSVLAILTYTLLAGKLTPDGIHYLVMAMFSDTNQLCMKNGELYGIFACAYPILMNLSSLIFNTDLFISSKLLNCLILVIHYCIFSHIFKSQRLALVITLLPYHAFISIITSSESVILLSFSLFCLALHRIERKNNLDITSYTIVFISILIGCLSRYAFAPFSVFLFLASFLIINRRALLLLPAFILNALIFVIYKYFTSLADKERIFAPEDIDLLILLFGHFVSTYSKNLLLAFTPILIVKINYLRFNRLNEILKSNWAVFLILFGITYLTSSFILSGILQYSSYGTGIASFYISSIASGILITYRNREYLSFNKLNEISKSNWGAFFILAGFSYLALAFALRAIISYDLYNHRFLGLGLSLIASGILITYKDFISKSNFIVVVICILLCQALINRVTLYHYGRESLINGNFFNKNALLHFVDAQQNARNKILIPLGSSNSITLQGTPIRLISLRYNDEFIKLIPGHTYFRHLTVDEFHSTELKGAECRFFFPPDLTEKGLKEYLSQRYLIGRGKYKDRFSPELKEFVLRKFNTKDTDCY